MPLPKRIHHVLLREYTGASLMETLCDIIVVPQRRETDDYILGFKTQAGNPVQCVQDPRDVTCNTCQHVWRKIRD